GLLARHAAHVWRDRAAALRSRHARCLFHHDSGHGSRTTRGVEGTIPLHSPPILYGLSAHLGWIWPVFCQLAESAGHGGHCADWLQLSHACRGARSPGPTWSAVSHVHGTDEAAHSLSGVMVDNKRRHSSEEGVERHLGSSSPL